MPPSTANRDPRRRVTGLACCLLLMIFTAAPASGPQINRAVSLRVLQQRLQQCSAGAACADQVQQCGGLRVAHGIIVDTVTHDLILLGDSKAATPGLRLDDLIVAMRSAWGLYDSVDGYMRYKTYPGCSIDPDPDVVARLSQVAAADVNSPDALQALRKNWEALCNSPQRVVVLAVPSSSHFAQVAVEADYLLKDIANGNEKTDIPRFQSHLGLLAAALTHAVKNNYPPPAYSPMNRYWLAAGENECYQSDVGWCISHCDVQLLTETQYLSSLRSGTATGEVDSLARAFADNFTAHYRDFGERYPVYRELSNLYRLCLLATMAYSQSLDKLSDLDLTYLLDDYQIECLPHQTSLPGRCAFKELEIPAGSNASYTLTLLAFGGVSVDIAAKEVHRAVPEPELVQDLRRILVARPSPEALFWDVSPVGIH